MPTKSANIERSSIVVAAKDQRSSEIGKEIVILDLKAEEYYGLNSLGAEIWKLIQTPQQVTEIIEYVVNHCEIEAQQCEQDLVKFLKQLMDNELVEIQN